ncbi:type II toxin-antitoxin system ParD family antitoxin [Jiella sp. M17.18]|uniref:ribbon-helix-helix domain-containing protein n=1 Tax=Jiella sp. M17.18 TaxID=3234247 RepID=UPI0034DFB6B2
MADLLHVTLPDDLMREIAVAVESGNVATADELVEQALTAYFEQDRERRLEGIRARVRRALDDPRPSVPSDEAFARIRRDLVSRSGET